MFDDNDIKIAGNRPSDSIKRNNLSDASSEILSEATLAAAKKFGAHIAEKFSIASNAYSDAIEDNDVDMMVQRILLLSFTVTAVFESSLLNETVSGVAQKSFLDTLKKNDSELYNTSSDTGAFSFYYLAFRRGSEIDRRIGQTFAMLCAHDGDPVYQELGEALYCWFLSVVRKAVKELEFGN